MNERKYLAISIKHTEHGWKFGKPCVLWGYKRTADDEKRCGLMAEQGKRMKNDKL